MSTDFREASAPQPIDLIGGFVRHGVNQFAEPHEQAIRQRHAAQRRIDGAIRRVSIQRHIADVARCDM